MPGRHHARPHWRREPPAGCRWPERARTIESHPNARDQLRCRADEPHVLGAVGGARLSQHRQLGRQSRARRRSSSAFHHVREQHRHDERGAGLQGRGSDHAVLEQDLAGSAPHFVDEAGEDAVAPVCERRERRHQLQGNHVGSAEEARRIRRNQRVGDAAGVRRLHHRRHPDALPERDGGPVRGDAQRLAQVQRPIAHDLSVRRGVVRRKLCRVEQRGHRHAALDRRRPDERLEGGPRLTPGLRHPIELRELVIAPAHQRADVARMGVERDEHPFETLLRIAVALLGRNAPELAGLGSLDLPDQFLLGGTLEAGIDRRPHAQPLRLRVLAKTVVQLLPDRRHEPGRAPLLLLGAEARLASLRQGLLLGGDGLRLDHLCEHQIAALEREVREPAGVVARRRLGQRSEQRGLGQGQVQRGAAEISSRGGLHAVVPVPQVDLVQVHLQDLLLVEFPLDAAGDDHLRQLATQRAGAGKAVGEDVARQLHGDRARAFPQRKRAEVAPDGPRDPAPVDSGVVVETVVLDRQECRHQFRRHRGERNDDALFGREPREQLAVTVEYEARLRRLVIAQRAHGRAAERDDADARRGSGEQGCGAPGCDAHTFRHFRKPGHPPRNNRTAGLPPEQPHVAELPPAGANPQGFVTRGTVAPCRVTAC